MLSNLYFDETDLARKKIQGVYMGKIDCVVEALQEKYDEGKNQGISKGKMDANIEIAKKLLKMNSLSVEEISKITDLYVCEIENLKNDVQS